MRQRHVGIYLQPLMMTSPLYDKSAPVPYMNTSQPAYTRIDEDRRLFIMKDSQCASRPGSGILLRRSWSISLVFVMVPFGCMMILLSGWMSDVFSGDRSSSKVTLASEYISAFVCILLGLAHPGFDINLLTELLVFNFIPFPAGAPRQVLVTHRPFQVAHPLVSSRFLWCHVLDLLWCMLKLLCPVQILYQYDQQYPF